MGLLGFLRFQEYRGFKCFFPAAVVGMGLCSGVAVGQAAKPAQGGSAPAAPVAAPMGEEERIRWVAEALAGKSLFLRGFYLTNDLKYDGVGRVQGAPKVGEWTVAGVNVLKVQPRPGEIELDGVRVAVRYNPDQHQFERHALNDDKVRIVIAEAGGVKGFEAAVAAVFAVGIDPGLQRTMPDYWQHYFNAALEWPQDSLTGVTAYPTYGMPNQAKDGEPAK